MAKKFKQVKDMDFIYMLNPFSLKVESLRVKLIKGLDEEFYRNASPSVRQKKEWVSITYYRSELILQVTDLSMAHTQEVILDGNDTMMLVAVPIEDEVGLRPVPFSADRQFLEEWMRRTG